MSTGRHESHTTAVYVLSVDSATDETIGLIVREGHVLLVGSRSQPSIALPKKHGQGALRRIGVYRSLPSRLCRSPHVHRTAYGRSDRSPQICEDIDSSADSVARFDSVWCSVTLQTSLPPCKTLVCSHCSLQKRTPI